MFRKYFAMFRLKDFNTKFVIAKLLEKFRFLILFVDFNTKFVIAKFYNTGSYRFFINTISIQNLL